MKLTFLSYCPRSGSTKLAQMLSESVLALPEFRSAIWLIERNPTSHRYSSSEIQTLLSEDPQLSENLGLGGEDISAIATRCAGWSGVDIVREIVRLWCERQSVDEPASVLLKVGRMVEVADEVMGSDSAVSMLFLVRDPRAVILSMATTVVPRDPRSGTFSRGSGTYSARLWLKRLRAFCRLQESFVDRCHLVRFEDLADPLVIDVVADFVGRADATPELSISSVEESLHPNVHAQFDRGHNEKWRSGLPRKTVRRSEILCRREMIELGYELDDPMLPSVLERAASGIASASSVPLSMVQRGRTVIAGRYR